jgi:hypothetical protein
MITPTTQIIILSGVAFASQALALGVYVWARREVRRLIASAKAEAERAKANSAFKQKTASYCYDRFKDASAQIAPLEAELTDLRAFRDRVMEQRADSIAKARAKLAAMREAEKGAGA